jgi:ceramide glucosyltransferase
MTVGQFAAGYCLAATALQTLSTTIAAIRCRKPGASVSAPKNAPAVSIVRPICGVEAFSNETLGSSYALDYPSYELIFCVARADDPVAGIARRLVAAHPEIPSRVLIGDDRVSANPKLNNCVKGWRAASHRWIILADSNVLMPKDYIQRLMSEYDVRAGLVCAPPIGSAPATFAAEVECAFLNTYQARWQYAGEAIGFGFAQGKTMLWRRDVLEAGGGIDALGAELAEDAAATKLIHRQGLKARLVDAPFGQPLGVRKWREVWSRQVRWARLRRATFPLHFAPEILTGGLLALIASYFGAGSIGFTPVEGVGLTAIVWYGSEIVLAFVTGWRLGWQTPIALLLRDLALPWLWVQAWAGDAFVWHGHAMSVADEGDPAAIRR